MIKIDEGFSHHPQLKALSSWSQTEEMNETKLELRQPFTSTLSQLFVHTLSQQPQKGQFSSQQVGCINLV